PDGHGDVLGDGAQDVEVDVGLDGVGGAAPHGPDHARQGPEESAVDGGQAAQGFGLLAGDDGDGLLGQVGEDASEQIGVEDGRGLAERAQGGAFASGGLLDFCGGGGGLESAQAGEGGAEEVEQDQRDVLVVKEFAVVGLVILG